LAALHASYQQHCLVWRSITYKQPRFRHFKKEIRSSLEHVVQPTGLVATGLVVVEEAAAVVAVVAVVAVAAVVAVVRPIWLKFHSFHCLHSLQNWYGC